MIKIVIKRIQNVQIIVQIMVVKIELVLINNHLLILMIVING